MVSFTGRTEGCPYRESSALDFLHFDIKLLLFGLPGNQERAEIKLCLRACFKLCC